VKLLLSLNKALQVFEINVELILSMVVLQRKADIFLSSLVSEHTGSVIDCALLAAHASATGNGHRSMGSIFVRVDEGRPTLAATGLSKGFNGIGRRHGSTIRVCGVSCWTTFALDMLDLGPISIYNGLLEVANSNAACAHIVVERTGAIEAIKSATTRAVCPLGGR
jgi:hypothetical protein